MVGGSGLNKEGVPLSVAYTKDSEKLQVFELLYSQGAFTRPFFVAPGVPKERVEALRTAFMKAMADPQAIAEAERQRLVITAIAGADLEMLVKKLYDIPKPVIDKLKTALEGD